MVAHSKLISVNCRSPYLNLSCNKITHERGVKPRASSRNDVEQNMIKGDFSMGETDVRKRCFRLILFQKMSVAEGMSFLVVFCGKVRPR